MLEDGRVDVRMRKRSQVRDAAAPQCLFDREARAVRHEQAHHSTSFRPRAKLSRIKIQHRCTYATKARKKATNLPSLATSAPALGDSPLPAIPNQSSAAKAPALEMQCTRNDGVMMHHRKQRQDRGTRKNELLVQIGNGDLRT
jgi:hypothetical protein